MSDGQQPPWDAADKPGSLLAFALWLHQEARETFLQDRTHAQIVFLFADDGLASMNPIPPNTGPAQVVAGVRRAVQEHALYGVVTVAEAWTYFPRNTKDHTVFQLLDGEMQVADLKEGDRTEALMVQMESRDGEQGTWLDPILRNQATVRLGATLTLPPEKCLNVQRFFE